MPEYPTRPLTIETWADFARLVEANSGVWGGCWCMWYHSPDPAVADTPEARRQAKERLVQDGRALASLVYDGGECVGWCQFGRTADLTRIHNSKAYHATHPNLPDWRITCFFSGKGNRGKGVAAAALQGALAQIAEMGGGHVEGYPEDTEGRKASPAFLFNGALSTFEAAGFTRTRLIGKHKWVVTRDVVA